MAPTNATRTASIMSRPIVGPKTLYDHGEGEDNWSLGYQDGVGDWLADKRDDHLYLEVDPDSFDSATEVTWESIKVELDDYSTAEIDWLGLTGSYSADREAIFKIDDATSARDQYEERVINTDGFDTVDQLDISGLSDEYHLQIHVYSNPPGFADIEAYEVRLKP